MHFRVCVKHDSLHLRIHFKAVQRKFFFYVQKQFAIFRFGDFIIDFPVAASLNKPLEWHLQNDHKIVQMLQRITFSRFSFLFPFSFFYILSISTVPTQLCTEVTGVHPQQFTCHTQTTAIFFSFRSPPK